MSNHTLRVLEFEKVRAMIGDRCLSEEGRYYIAEQAILTDAEAVQVAQQLTSEYRGFLENGDEPQMLQFPPIREAVQRLRAGGAVLEGAALAGVAGFIDSARRLSSALAEHPDEFRELRALVAEMPNLGSLAKRIHAVIDATGEVKENEVPSLRAIRKRAVGLQQDITRMASGFLSDNRYSRVFNSDRPTVRDGRTVLAVAASHKNAIPGVVHEVSGSGQTVFLEPLQLVEKNNALAEAHQEYRRELLRLLRELSEACARERPGLLRQLDIVAELDAVRAKALWSIDFNAVRPQIDAAEIRLHRARHPMLGSAAVPIDVALPEGVRTLIITGPNTGGKTVAVKTVGLFALCHQFGVQIPAEEGSALPLFGAVFADIGDEQSIEQSLSTFSGHMTRIAEIAAHAAADSLVLLDELGAGTDPSEGVAIGAALLEYFAEHSARVLLTTHHGALKRYGFARDDAENASVEFDQRKLTPTFRLLTGVPGASHALEVAERCGLPHSVLRRAAALLQSGRSGADELVIELTERERELHLRESETKDLQRNLRAREQQLAAREHAIRERELALKREAAGEYRRLVEESRSRVENLVRSLREGELTREKTRRARSELDELSLRADDQERRINAESNELERRERELRSSVTQPESRTLPRKAEERPAVPMRPGVTARERSTGRTGVLRRKNSDGSWSVNFGAIRFSVPEHDLEPLEAGKDSAAASGAGVSYLPSEEGSEGPVFELDLRGMRLEEAVVELERQIDRCLMSGAVQFGVIHGKGEGVLQQGTRAFLSEHAAVARIAYAGPDDGGHGKTIVELRR